MFALRVGCGSDPRFLVRRRGDGLAFVAMALSASCADGTAPLRRQVSGFTEPVRVVFEGGGLQRVQNITVSNALDIAVVGTTLDTIVAVVTSGSGDPIPNVLTSWSVESGGGQVVPLGSLTDSSGRTRALWTTGPAIGSQGISVSVKSLSAVLTVTARQGMKARQVSSGADHTCAVTDDDVGYCWGSNWAGQLGIGSDDRIDHPFPQLVAERFRIKSIAAGASHTCALALNGDAYCWGNNRNGQLGFSGPENVNVPTKVPNTPAFESLAHGWSHTCGLTSSGRAICWGDNSVGQLGHGADRTSPEPWLAGGVFQPVEVQGYRFTVLSAGLSSTCGITTEGATLCWGQDAAGLLRGASTLQCRLVHEDWGIPPTEALVPCSTSPVRIGNTTPMVSITMDLYGACAVLVTEELECWGNDRAPRRLPGATIKEAWLLPGAVCTRDMQARIRCWWHTTLADYDPFGNAPALVQIHSSGRHHCGITPVGSQVYCWDTNYNGALGDGTTIHRPFPVAVIGPSVSPTP